MKKQLILLFVLFASSVCFSQYYYSGYVDGFKKACSCNKSIPSNSTTNKYGTYNDGYEAGFADGRIYLNNNKKEEKNYNLYKPDFKIVYKALDSKQGLLDKRREELVKILDETVEYFIEYNKILGEVSDDLKRQYDNYFKVAEKYLNYNLTSDDVFYQVKNWFKDQRRIAIERCLESKD